MLQITALHTPRQIIVPQDKEKLPYTLDTKTHNTAGKHLQEINK